TGRPAPRHRVLGPRAGAPGPRMTLEVRALPAPHWLAGTGILPLPQLVANAMPSSRSPDRMTVGALRTSSQLTEPAGQLNCAGGSRGWAILVSCFRKHERRHPDLERRPARRSPRGQSLVAARLRRVTASGR